MMAGVRSIPIVAIAVVLAGCGGGGSTPAGQLVLSYSLINQTAQPAAPLAAGQSWSFTFRENVCRSYYDPKSVGNQHTTCDQWITPSAIVPTADSACPVIVVVTGAASMTVTKTAATQTLCQITVTDPQTHGIGFAYV